MTVVGSLRRSEVWARWIALADELALPVGRPTDLVLGDPVDGQSADDDEWQAPDVEEAIDRLIGAARLPRWRLDRERLAIEADPLGSPDLASLVADLEGLAEVDRRRRAVEELRANAGPGGLPVARVARRWGIRSRDTLYRWVAEVGTVRFSPPNRTDDTAPPVHDRGERGARPPRRSQDREDRWPSLP